MKLSGRRVRLLPVGRRARIAGWMLQGLGAHQADGEDVLAFCRGGRFLKRRWIEGGDCRLPFEGEEFEKNHDASIIWEAHRVGRDKAYCHIEKLTNLDQLPVPGFKVSCFPVSIKAASAGRPRVEAFVA